MKNKTIAILENRAGEQLADLVRKYGGMPFSAPALAEVPDIDPALITRLINDWQQNVPDIFIFQTGVGVKALFAATEALGMIEQFKQILESSIVIVRGVKPSSTLRPYKVRIDATAGDPFTTNEVLAELDKYAVKGRRVAVQRYGDTNFELQQALETRGALVTEIATYRWSLPADTQPLIALMDALDSNKIDMVCFTSASQVYNFFAVAEQLGRHQSLKETLNKSMVASIGPVCTVALSKFGIKVDVEPQPPKLGPFITAMNAKFA